MGVLPVSVILSCLFLGEISGYTIKNIEGVENKTIDEVHFDKKGNTYVLTHDDLLVRRLYKLNAFNEVSAVTDIPHNVIKMLVNSRGDTYFNNFDYDQVLNRPNSSLGIVRSGSSEIELIYDINWIYLDNSDNLFCTKDQDPNLYVLRFDSSALVAITNTKNVTYHFAYSGLAVSDALGNTYIPTKTEAKEYLLALVTKEALQEKEPHPNYLNPLVKVNEAVTGLIVDQENNLWMSTFNTDNNTGAVKKFANGNWTTILGDENKIIDDHQMMLSKGRLYYLIKQSEIITVYCITSKNEVIEIPELKIIFRPPLELIKSVDDSRGQTYLYAVHKLKPFSDFLGRVITLKPNETKPIPNSLKDLSESSVIKSALVDFNDDLWIITILDFSWGAKNREGINVLHHLKKGGTVANTVDNFTETCNLYKDSRIYVNSVTKKIYVSCNKGLVTVI